MLNENCALFNKLPKINDTQNKTKKNSLLHLHIINKGINYN